jgi:hypothetical protein
MNALVLQEPTKRFNRCCGVLPLLHQDIQNLAFIVDGAPEPHPPPFDLYDNLVEVPSAWRPAAATSDICCDYWPEMVDPASDRFSADLNSALSQQFFDVAKAHCEPKIQPDCMADDVRWEPVTLERQRFGHHGLQIGIQAENGDMLALNCQHRFELNLGAATRSHRCDNASMVLELEAWWG